MYNLILVLSFVFISLNANSQQKYFVVFLADDGILGHAFITIGRESISESMSVYDGTWGMYPNSDSFNAKELVIGEVPGKLKDDYLRNSDYKFICEVNSDEYSTIKEIILKWKNKKYQLRKSDCLTFIIEIANSIDHKINVPERKYFENLPAKFLKKLIKVNSL